jgi:hypothetical protein
LVRGKGLIACAAAAVVFAACKPAPTPARPRQQVPQIRATVVTIRTTLQPQNKTFTHSLVIAEGRARSGDEVDSWRLYDTREKKVTFVDDVAKTSRSVPFAALIDARRKALATPVHAPVPHAQIAATGAKRVLHGVEAAERVVRLGGYERRLWIAKHPAVPDELFAMSRASAPPSSPLAGIMHAVDGELMSVQGFPLLDRAELPYGKKKMVVERSVVKIEQKDVPASWLTIAKDYKDLTVTTPAARPRSAS